MENASCAIGKKSDTTPSRPVPHIRELDGIRGIAALAVFFHHVCFTTIAISGWGLPVRILYGCSRSGSYGVSLFFILSGFLITSILLADRGQENYYGNFYWKRALRILPVYALGLLIFLALYPNAKTFVLLCVVFLPNFASVLGVVPHGPFWTLAIEEQFYLVWPTLVHRRTLEQVKRWSAWVVLLSIASRFGCAAIGHSNYYLTPLSCDGLAAGAWIACWMKQKKDAHGRGANETVYAGLALCAGAAAIGISLLPRLSIPFATAFKSTGADIVLASVFVLVLLHRGAPILATLRAPIPTFFGLISYAFYMLHLRVLELYDRTIGLPAANDYLAYAMRLTTVFVASLVLGLLSRYLLERPVMSLRRHVLRPGIRRP